MPERIQLRRTKGWRKPEGAVVVSRPTVWGNPYSVGKCSRSECGRALAHWHVYLNRDPMELAPRDRAEATDWAIWLYRTLLAGMPEFREIVRSKLAGRDLACWCPLDQPCHADVLLEIANG